MNLILLGFIAYLALVVVVGLATYRLNRTGADYLLAGRRLPTWVATFSERASGESAWLLLGFPGAVLLTGLVEAWTAIGCVLGIGLSWWVVAGRLRRETERLGVLTLPEYFVRRFGAAGQLIRLVATAIVIFFFACYLSAQLNGAGKILDVTFGIPHLWGMVLGTVIIVAYTVMGGFFAVAWTDLIQGILMLGTLVVLPLVAWAEVAAVGADVGAALDRIALVRPGVNSLVHGETGWAAVALVVGGLSWGLGYLGQPHVLIRYMAIRSPEAVRQGRVIAFGWALLGFSGAFFIGLFGAALVDWKDLVDARQLATQFPELAARWSEMTAAEIPRDVLEKLIAAQVLDPERLMPFMATHLLPALLAGIFISGAVAAMMSTADSQLLVTTSAVAEDLLHRGLKPGLDHRKMVRISRLTALAVGVSAFLLARTSDRLIYDMVSYAWAGLGASFGPALVLSLYWRRTTGAGVVAGMLTGSITTVLWSEIAIGGTPLNDVMTVRFVSFVLAALAVWSVSRLSEKNAPGAFFSDRVG
ncbi:MAG: sodium/proline symporter [Planctomycetes bacterium]|nr:sodium/proline symporter [Planctomycetota bacterium]